MEAEDAMIAREMTEEEFRREKEDEELARAIGDMEEEMKQEKQRTEDEKLARRFVQQQEEEKNKKTT